MSDSGLIGVFITNKGAFDKHHGMVPRHLLEPETQVLIEDIEEWYKTHADDICPNDINPFWEWMRLVRHSNMAASKLEAFKAVLKNAVAAAPGQEAAEILKSLVLRDHAGRIAEKADKYSAGNTGINLYDELFDDVEEAQQEAGIHESHSNEVEMCIHSIMDQLTNLKDGLNFRSPALCSALGPIRQGDFIMFAGFVDSGKSTLLASEVTFLASQLPPGKVALYFNNEERGAKVGGRLFRAGVGWTQNQLNSNRTGAQQEYINQLGQKDKVILVDSEKSPITPGLIRKKLRQYDVGLMVFDQMYKIKGFKRNGEDKLGQLQDIFEYGRQLAKQHCPVIAVHQARGDANGCEKIEMHQLAGSQQALQGELDAIVTIGRSLNSPKMRYLYVPKNKMDTPGDEKLRNGFFEIEPRFDIGRFDE